MESKRLLGSLAVFAVLALLFSGASGLATAASQNEVYVPLPMAGDAASYVIKEVIDDPDIAIGQVIFNWARAAWRDETMVPDETGNLAPFAPFDFTLQFREGSSYGYTSERRTYYEIPSREAFMDEYQGQGYSEYGQQMACINGNCLSERHGTDTFITARTTAGAEGMCGVLTPLHGAIEPPKTMDVTGYCRDYRTVDDEDTTRYRLHKETTWKGRDAVVYERVDDSNYRITYANGIPFPVKVDLPLAEHVTEAYTLGRHFHFELRDYNPGDAAYPERPPRAQGEPLPTVDRDPILQIDETGLTGFTLQDAYNAALASTESPRLADFMGRPGAYIAAAWKSAVRDSDGNEILYWTFYAFDGERDLAKRVRMESPSKLAGVDMDWQGAEQYSVSDPGFDAGVTFPPAQRLPDQVVQVAAALERSKAYMGNTEPNAWGFYAACENEGCTSVDIKVRAGGEVLPSNGMQFGTQGLPGFYQHLSFFNSQGLLSHTWDLESERGQDPLLPLDSVGSDGSGPTADSASSPAWVPPGPAAVASLGFLALLGAALYYFWPAVKMGAVGMFTRIKDDDLLRHPRRQAIHQAISADPGIHFQELNRRVGTGRGSLDHHLRKLEHGGLIVRQKDTGSTLFFPKGAVDRRVMQATGLLRASSTRKVLDEVVRKPGLQCADIAARTGLSNPTVSYHLGKLRKEGIIGRGRQLTLTPHGESLLSMAS